jgi:hypothetical protein
MIAGNATLTNHHWCCRSLDRGLTGSFSGTDAPDQTPWFLIMLIGAFGQASIRVRLVFCSITFRGKWKARGQRRLGSTESACSVKWQYMSPMIKDNKSIRDMQKHEQFLLTFEYWRLIKKHALLHLPLAIKTLLTTVPQGTITLCECHASL